MSNIATQIKPGQVLNPNGRPKKEWTMKGLIIQSLEEETGSGIPYKKLVANKLRGLALMGDMTAIKEVNNRIDGMPKQDVSLDGEISHIIITRDEETDE